MESNSPLRGEIYWLDWSPGRGSEQTGRRPALVVQRDVANRNENYPNTIVVAVSTKGKPVPFHVEIPPDDANGLTQISYAKCEQLQTASKERLIDRIGKIDPKIMAEVDIALKKVLDLT
jgi:mRNA interferase MazF